MGKRWAKSSRGVMAVMEGYWRQPDASAEALRGGWFHTGDMATLNEEGYLLIGRPHERPARNVVSVLPRRLSGARVCSIVSIGMLSTHRATFSRSRRMSRPARLYATNRAHALQ